MMLQESSKTINCGIYILEASFVPSYFGEGTPLWRRHTALKMLLRRMLLHRMNQDAGVDGMMAFVERPMSQYQQVWCLITSEA